MTQFDYTQDIPNGPNNPSADVQPLKVNTNSAFGIIAVDHNGYGVPNGGWHTDIHMVPQSPPAPILGIGQLFTQNVTVNSATDTQLFFQTGIAGGLSQLTGNHSANPGWSIASGIIIQWGTVTPVVNRTLTPVNFNRSFNNIFVVVVTEKRTNSPNGVDQIYVNAKTNTSFSYYATTNGTGFDSFDYIAIGN